MAIHTGARSSRRSQNFHSKSCPIRQNIHLLIHQLLAQSFGLKTVPEKPANVSLEIMRVHINFSPETLQGHGIKVIQVVIVPLWHPDHPREKDKSCDTMNTITFNESIKCKKEFLYYKEMWHIFLF